MYTPVNVIGSNISEVRMIAGVSNIRDGGHAVTWLRVRLRGPMLLLVSPEAVSVAKFPLVTQKPGPGCPKAIYPADPRLKVNRDFHFARKRFL